MRSRAILGENGIGKWFYDYPEDNEFFNEEIIGYLDEFNMAGSHVCQHSAIWEDVTGIVDELQDEEKLPEGKYIVCWYYCDENYDLQQLVDFNISKEQIIENIKNQKYFEGADYYLMKELEMVK